MISRSSIRSIAVAALMLWLAPAAAQAQADPHVAIKPALASLHATAQRTDGTTVRSAAVGFVVSGDGLVLTVSDLVTRLGDVNALTVKISAKVDGKTMSATEVDTAENLNLLLLKLVGDSEGFTKVEFSPSRGLPASAGIFMSGYDTADAYRTFDGSVSARETDDPRLWQTSLDFDEGFAGSPVYAETGAVFGIAADRAQHIIPIELANTLLASVRVSEIERQIFNADPKTLAGRLTGIESAILTLQQQFNWEGRIDREPSGEAAWIYFKALLPGGAIPESLTVKITPEGETRDGVTKPFETSPEKVLPRDAGFAGTADFDGRFEIPTATATLDFYKSQHELARIALRLDFRTKLSDGVELPPKRVYVNR